MNNDMFTSLIVQIRLPNKVDQQVIDEFVYIPHSSDKTANCMFNKYFLPWFTSLIVQIRPSPLGYMSLGHWLVYIPHSSDKTRKEGSGYIIVV